jgi:hypothetical protein
MAVSVCHTDVDVLCKYDAVSLLVIDASPNIIYVLKKLVSFFALIHKFKISFHHVKIVVWPHFFGSLQAPEVSIAIKWLISPQLTFLSLTPLPRKANTVETLHL